MSSKDFHNYIFYTLTILLAMVCISVFTPLSVSADDFSVADGILTKYNGPGGAVNIPSNVQKIGGSAFQDNESVTSVSIPEGCFAIEDGAFDGCINMKTVSLPNTLTSIGTLAFARCKSLEYVHLPSGLETIKGGAFYDCERLGSVQIPSGTKTIENGCFSNCDSLILLETDPSNSSFITVDNVLYTADRKTLLQYPAGKTDTSFTIPDGVETVAADSFKGQKHLKEIVFSSSVREIREKAFSGCTSLSSVDLPENIQKIYELSFRNCTNLCRVYVHNKDQQTVATAFSGDSSVIIYGYDDSRIHTHAKKYNIRFRTLDKDVYDQPDPEMIF